MQLDYLLTLDDFVEAQKAATPIKQSRRVRNGFLGWAMLGAMATLSTLLLTLHTPMPMRTGAGSPLIELPPEQNLWITLTPPLVLCGFFLISVIIGGIATRRRARLAMASNSAPSQMPPSKLLGYTVMLPLVLLALPVFPVFNVDWRPEPAMIEIVSFGPWILLIFIAVLMGRFTRRTAAINLFARQRSARRPTTMQATADHLTVDDGSSFHRWHWVAFDRYQETKNLVNLITEDESMLIIPKRAVPDPGDLDALRGLIQTKISRGTFLPRDHRFPVLPAPVLPIWAGDQHTENSTGSSD